MNRRALIVLSLAILLTLATTLHRGNHWYMAADEFMIGEITATGFAFLFAYLLVRWAVNRWMK